MVLRKKKKIEEDIRALEKAYDENITRVARLVNQETEVVSATEGVVDVTPQDTNIKNRYIQQT